jgi:hypothetical protein
VPSRLTLALGALVLCLSGALYGTVRWGLSEAAAATQLQTRVHALSTEVIVLDARLRGVQPELQRQRDERKEAGVALDQNPDWRTTAVPGAITDGLCRRLRCAPVHPVPTPNR